MKIKNLIGRKVKLYPGDTYDKFALVTDINEQGFLFEITESKDNLSYPVGSFMFIGFGSNLRFIVV